MWSMQATWLIWGKKEVVNNINKIIIEIVHNHQSIVKKIPWCHHPKRIARFYCYIYLFPSINKNIDLDVEAYFCEEVVVFLLLTILAWLAVSTSLKDNNEPSWNTTTGSVWRVFQTRRLEISLLDWKTKLIIITELLAESQ